MDKKELLAIDCQVGANIRATRTKLGVNITTLAKRCNVTFQQMQKYEAGKNRVSASRLVQIARALGVDVCDLLEVDGHV